VTQRIIFLYLALPRIMQIGLLFLAAGGTLDLLYHAAPPGWSVDLERYLGRHGEGVHLVTLVGMVVTLLGLPVRRAAVRIVPVADTASERRPSVE
jgi:hypothetical protein